MIFESPYWDNTTKLQLLAWWLVVHSYIYYELNINIVTDSTFDDNCKQFMAISKSDKQAFKNHKLYYIMYDFDGSTGFHLCERLNESDREKLLSSVGSIINLTRGVHGRQRD
jgi:hypothetical protein